MDSKIKIVLVEPQIPPNTGNIARFCTALKCSLHLVGPLGFELDDKKMKRAGLDYWKEVEWYYYKSLHEFELSAKQANKYYVSSKGQKVYYDINFNKEDWIIFGSEDYGLPCNLLEQNIDRSITIPMPGKVRCINLSSAVAIVVSEALRQINNKSII